MIECAGAMSNIATKYMIIKCPYCAFGRTWSIRRNKRKCKRCKREFSEQIYPIAGIRSTSEEWIRCISAFVRQRTLARVQQETSIPRCRSLIMVHYLRQCMATDIPSCFFGSIEMDETYIGGQRKNKRLHIRRISSKKVTVQTNCQLSDCLIVLLDRLLYELSQKS